MKRERGLEDQNQTKENETNHATKIVKKDELIGFENFDLVQTLADEHLLHKKLTMKISKGKISLQYWKIPTDVNVLTFQFYMEIPPSDIVASPNKMIFDPFVRIQYLDEDGIKIKPIWGLNVNVTKGKDEKIVIKSEAREVSLNPNKCKFIYFDVVADLQSYNSNEDLNLTIYFCETRFKNKK
jgi:hypothetical protein